jgi:hypothetical protein
MLGSSSMIASRISALDSILVILIQVDTRIARYIASGMIAAQGIVATLDLIGVL